MRQTISISKLRGSP